MITAILQRWRDSCLQYLSTATHLLPREARMTIATMKKCLFSTLLALAFACGAYAGPNPNGINQNGINQNGINQNGINQNGINQNGPVVSVPDNGNTALLLGTAILVLGIASRRFAIH